MDDLSAALDADVERDDAVSGGEDAGAKRQATTKAVLAAQRRLREALTPKYEHVFHVVSQQPGGMKFLVDMRHDLMSVISARRRRRRQSGSNDGQALPADGAVAPDAAPVLPVSAELGSLEEDLKRLLTEWFSVGFLTLRRITWDTKVGACGGRVGLEASGGCVWVWRWGWVGSKGCGGGFQAMGRGGFPTTEGSAGIVLRS